MLFSMVEVRQYCIDHIVLEPSERDYKGIKAMLDTLVYQGVIGITYQERNIVAEIFI